MTLELLSVPAEGAPRPAPLLFVHGAFVAAWPQHLWIRDAVGLPALVLGAGNDAFFPAVMTLEAARFHGVTPHVFPDMAHAMMLEPGWRDVAARIHAWLEEQAPAPAASPAGAA